MTEQQRPKEYITTLDNICEGCDCCKRDGEYEKECCILSRVRSRPHPLPAPDITPEVDAIIFMANNNDRVGIVRLLDNKASKAREDVLNDLIQEIDLLYGIEDISGSAHEKLSGLIQSLRSTPNTQEQPTSEQERGGQG